MKKIIAFAVVLLLFCSGWMVAYADLDEGEFDNWYVICGPAGYSFEDHDYGENMEGVTIPDYIEPGIRLWVHSFDPATKKYLLAIRDENHDIKGFGHVYVTEAQLNKYFIGEKKTVVKETGEKQDKAIDCVVTPKIGLVLRQGPAKTYPAYRTIPQNAKLSYQYVREYDGLKWGYTTYKGQSGWVCIDYTKAIAAPTTEPVTEATTETTTEPTTESTTETTTESTTESTTEMATAPSTSPAAPTTDAAEHTSMVAPSDEAPESAGFFESTKTVILTCCAGAVVLALTAVVILMIIKRKNNTDA